MRFNVVVWAYTIWLIAMFGALYVTHSVNPATDLQLVLLCGVIPGGLQLLLLGIDWHGLVAPFKMWLAFLLIVLLSYLAGVTDPQLAPRSTGELAVPAAWLPIVYTLNVVFILGIGILVAGCPDRRLLRSVAGLYCILLTPFLMYIVLTGARTWGNRLAANGLQENTWGVMGLLLCFGALALRNRVLAFAGFATGIATIIASDSRENLVCVAAGLFVIGALEWRTMVKGSRLFAVLAGSCLALVMIAMLLDPYVYDAIHYIKADIFVVDDPLRGVGSGVSGRSGLWEAAYDTWLKSPVLGVGYRMHEQFLPDGMPGHNAYLAMLADTGVVGFVWYFVLLIGSLLASLGIQDQWTRRFVVAMIVARFIGGMFDRITIDGGNMNGLLFIMCTSVALADQSLRKATSLLQEPPPANLSFLPTRRAPL
ncbi:MAG TPA: O-antigen ligase family protein [Stellaceae bacterium]|nr:O-antigen ligase family protein [Stellaceae bacterium]